MTPNEEELLLEMEEEVEEEGYYYDDKEHHEWSNEDFESLEEFEGDGYSSNNKFGSREVWK